MNIHTLKSSCFTHMYLSQGCLLKKEFEVNDRVKWCPEEANMFGCDSHRVKHLKENKNSPQNQ